MKLNDQVIDKLLKEGRSVIEIARLYGCSRQAIYDSKKRNEQCMRALGLLKRKAKKQYRRSTTPS